MRAPARMGAFRARAESLMTDTCRITRPGDGPRVGPDPVTLQYTDPAPVVVYEGKCKLQHASRMGAQATQALAGEAAWDVTDLLLHLPMAGSDDVATNCTVTYLTSATNPSLVGRMYGVIAVGEPTHVTARRCRVREVVGLS